VHFRLQHDGSVWTWALIGDEDESLAQGMRYARRSEVEHAILLVRGAPGNGCRFVKVRRAVGAWYWHLKSPNGKVLTRGDGLATEVQVDRAIALVQVAGRETAVRPSAASPERADDDPPPASPPRAGRSPVSPNPVDPHVPPRRLRVRRH